MQTNKLCRNEWYVKKCPVLTLIFYSDRVDFLLLVGRLTAVLVFSELPTPLDVSVSPGTASTETPLEIELGCCSIPQKRSLTICVLNVV